MSKPFHKNGSGLFGGAIGVPIREFAEDEQESRHNKPSAKATKKKHKRRDIVFERDGYKCLMCGATELLTIDHLIPLSKGGKRAEWNEVTMCRKCNNNKGSRLIKSHVELALSRKPKDVEVPRAVKPPPTPAMVKEIKAGCDDCDYTCSKYEYETTCLVCKQKPKIQIENSFNSA